MSENTIRFPFLDLAATDRDIRPLLEEVSVRVINSGRYIGGPEVEEFEQSLARTIGTRYAIGVSNGLDALRLILLAAIKLGRLKPGDDVLVPANTYVASYLAISDAGLNPVGVDIDPATMNLDSRILESAMTVRTRALMTVHLYGRVAWDDAMAGFVRRHNLFVVEDNAQAIGAVASCDGVNGPGKRMTGSLGHAAGFSFYPTKNIGALGDAGAVTTDDPELAAAVRALANYGSDRRYHNIYQGYNCRLDPIQAAMLNVKLQRLPQVCSARQEKASAYDRLITNPLVRKPSVPTDPTECVWHQYVVRVDDRDAFTVWLNCNGVGWDIHYAVPPHLQPCYAGLVHTPSPVTDSIAQQIVSLPISDGTSIEDIAAIAAIINTYSKDSAQTD